MKATLTKKILAEHLVSEDEKGGTISIRIDETLTQDATGTMAYLEFMTMGADRVKTDLSVSYVDHNTLQSGFMNADDHKFLQTVANKYGIVYSRAGNG
ncbi:MAG: aconitate hydratase, partial [Clostridia bacterium]|nr:aconitate hydratase [Clostridia bacterium]